MSTKQQRENLMQAFLETPEAKLWQEALIHIEMQLRLAEEKGNPNTLMQFLKLVLPEMKENPTMFAVLRERWNEQVVSMNLPDEIIG